MISAGLKNDLIELLGQNFKVDQINEIGKLLFHRYDSHAMSGTEQHITLSPRRCAGLLVDHCTDHKRLPELIQLVHELDQSSVLGRPIEMKGIEIFSHRLTLTGMVYDYRRRKFGASRQDPMEMNNWGALRDGKSYDCTVLSVDIVGNSQLVNRYGSRNMEKVYSQLWSFLRSKLSDRDGRLWSWAGDGGICAFTFKGHQLRGVLCALEIQRTISIFNMRENRPFDQDIVLRLGLDSGSVKFFSDTGKIVSEVINYAAHLEKRGTERGMISFSDRIAEHLDAKLLSLFRCAGEFEECRFWTSLERVDLIAGCDEPDPKTPGADQDLPAVSSGRIPHRSSAPVTRR